jgi:AraC family ethanolamine operon transcriptional activator
MLLSKGRFRGNLVRAECSKSIFDSGKYNLPLLATGDMPEDLVTLGFILDAQGDGILNGFSLNSNQPVVYTENSEMHYRLAPNTHWAALLVSRELLECNGVNLPNRLSAFIEAETAKSLQLAQTFQNALVTLQQASQNNYLVLDGEKLALSIRESILADYCSILSSESDSTGSTWRKAAKNQTKINRTIEYLKNHLADPVEIKTLAEISGVSWRTLQRIFIMEYGMAPKSFLNLLRLSKARRELLNGSRSEDSVGEIALQSGFFHLGRFSRDYLALYGESPRETKKHATRKI